MAYSLALQAGIDGLETAAHRVDPLARLLDPSYTETLWLYEESHTEPFVPGSLHPKQLEVIENDDRHRWLFWGNQVGKTTVGAVEVALLALGRHPYHQHWDPPLTIWASALTWDLWEQILLPELLTWIPPERVIDSPPPKDKSTKRTIKVRADNGSVTRIIGKSAEQGKEKYQSARVHAVWLDEEHPEGIWDELQPRLVRFGGITICTMTPLKGMTWVFHRIYDAWRQGKTEDHYCTHAGLADNPSIGEGEIEALKVALAGDEAQLQARLYGKFVRPTGLALNFDPGRHFWDAPQVPGNPDALPELVEREKWPLIAGVDFGSWRFAFLLGAVDRDGVVHVVEEVFSQRETLEERARRIDDVLQRYGAKRGTPIWGDAANPTDITEINEAFRRIGSPYVVVAVAMENKLRSASVSRINNLFFRDALVIRRDLAENQPWKLGQNAASEGKPTSGSRLLYEVNAWRYPPPKNDDEAQKQDPDDNTADGADAIAALRYMIMSWWREAPPEPPDPLPNEHYDRSYDELLATITGSGKRGRAF